MLYLIINRSLALKSLLKFFRVLFVITCSFLGQVNNLNRCLKFGVHYTARTIEHARIFGYETIPIKTSHGSGYSFATPITIV